MNFAVLVKFIIFACRGLHAGLSQYIFEKRFALSDLSKIAKIFTSFQDKAVTNAHVCRVSTPRQGGKKYAIKRGSGLFIENSVFGDTLINDRPNHPALFCSNLFSAAGMTAVYVQAMHIGARIREVLMHRSREHTVTWLSKKLNCHRVNVYDIFNRSTIDTELLRRISMVLGHDFFQDLSDELKKQGLEKGEERE